MHDHRNDDHEAVFIDEIKLTSLKKNLLDHHIQVVVNLINILLIAKIIDFLICSYPNSMCDRQQSV